MSYVFKIRNPAGQVQVSGDHMVPQFIGKIVTRDDNIRMQDGAESGFQSRSYSGQAPNFGGRPVIVFWTLPPDVWWYIPVPFMEAGASGAAHSGLFAYCAPNAIISGVPEGYVFALQSVQHSGVQPALRTWDANGTLLFDSGNLHLAIEAIAGNISYPYGSDLNAGIGLPAKPAFLVPMVTRFYEQYDGILNQPSGIADMKSWLGVVKRSGNALFSRMLLAAQGEMSASNPGTRAGYTQDQTYGNNSSLLMPIINAALYD